MVWEFRRRFCKSCLADAYATQFIMLKTRLSLPSLGSLTIPGLGILSARKGYMQPSNRFESTRSGSLCRKSTRKVVHFPEAHRRLTYLMFVPVAHGGRNVYHLKDDVERFADEALKSQSSGRDLLDLVNRYESLREIRAIVSVSHCAHSHVLTFPST